MNYLPSHTLVFYSIKVCGIEFQGGGLLYEIPRCVCFGSENVPIMKDTFGRIKHTHIEGILCTLYINIMV